MSKGTHRGLLSWKQAFARAAIVDLIGLILVLGILLFFSKDLPEMEELQNYDPDVITKIYSADGKVLHEFFHQNRIVLPGKDIPLKMRQAVMAIEDSRFRNHWGFSVYDFTRAIIINTLRMELSQGGSTLTQQLARIMYENIGFKKTITRKIKELITALKLEQLYTKDEIINMYLNSTYLGGAYGVEAAANRFFDKSAKNLTIAECAHFAGMIQNRRYSPESSNPSAGFRRRNYVLYRMFELGFISEETYNIEKNSPIYYPPKQDQLETAPYFVEDIRRFIQKEDERLGVNLYKDGLKIYTSLDTRLQKIAEEEYHRQMKKQQEVLNNRLLARPGELREIIDDTTATLREVQEMIRGERPMKKSLKKYLEVQGAFVCLNPQNGHILAMIGGRDYAESEFNRATQAKRQPGSVFKPIVYGTAIDNGVPVTKKLLNTPLTIPMPNGERWTPQNYNGETGGPTTLRNGIKKSLNIIAARVVQELVTPRAVIETAKRLHISTYIPEVDAIALGVGSVIPIEMVAAYSTFQNKGVWVKPHGITRIEDRYGNIIKEYVPEKEMVLGEDTAYMITSLLQTVIDHGTGGSARWKWHFTRNAAGKTGTTSDWSDAWFVGYTPHLVAGVYVGVDEPLTLGRHESGARVALPIWARFMKRTHDLLELPDQEFDVPENVIQVKICKDSKKLPSKYCTDLETEYFIKGTEPTAQCKIHSATENPSDNFDDLIF